MTEQLPPGSDEEKVSEGTGQPMEGIEVPADGTEATLTVDDPTLPEAPPLETTPEEEAS